MICNAEAGIGSFSAFVGCEVLLLAREALFWGLFGAEAVILSMGCSMTGSGIVLPNDERVRLATGPTTHGVSTFSSIPTFFFPRFFGALSCVFSISNNNCDTGDRQRGEASVWTGSGGTNTSFPTSLVS